MNMIGHPKHEEGARCGSRYHLCSGQRGRRAHGRHRYHRCGRANAAIFCLCAICVPSRRTLVLLSRCFLLLVSFLLLSCFLLLGVGPKGVSRRLWMRAGCSPSRASRSSSRRRAAFSTGVASRRRSRGRRRVGGARFITTPERGTDRHKQGLLGAQATDTVRTLIYSGRPVRTLMTDYVRG